MRAQGLLLATLAAGLLTPVVRAHELWFHEGAASDPNLVRLSFGDSPDLGEAERARGDHSNKGLGRRGSPSRSSGCPTAWRPDCLSVARQSSALLLIAVLFPTRATNSSFTLRLMLRRGPSSPARPSVSAWATIRSGSC